MALTAQQQTALRAVPQGQRAAFQQAYEADNARRTTGQAAVVGSGQPGSNPIGTGGAGSYYDIDPTGAQRTRVTPNLLPQEAQINADQARLTSELGSANRTKEMELAARLQADAETRRISNLSQISSAGGGGARVEHPAMADGAETAARNAAFARAKEQAGQTALATLKSIRGLSEDRGLMGSSIEASQFGGALGDAAGDINDFTREQYIQDLDRAGRISDLSYTGDIQQRGQDMQKLQSILSMISASGTAY